MPEPDGKSLRLDNQAKSAVTNLPAFLARPDDAPIYHGFPIVPESITDGWAFGTITEYEEPEGCEYGDAFVVAPDGSRAGLVWSVSDFPIHEVCAPDAHRWGVYEVTFQKPIRTTADFVECCHRLLPELKKIHAALKSQAGGR